MIASGAPAWAVWLALGLWGVALVVLAVAFLLARRVWRQWQPQIAPYLAMFMPADPSAYQQLSDEPAKPFDVDASNYDEYLRRGPSK